MDNRIKQIAAKEMGFMVISVLSVILIYLITGTFFKIWIKDQRTLLYMALIFYLIIGFYRWLNKMARRYQRKENHHSNK